MKKQLLFILMLVISLGIFITNVNAQDPAPRPVTCLTPDALHPIAGEPYTYSITVPDPTPGTPWTEKHYQWFVTQDLSIINSGNFVATVSPDGGPLMDVTGGSAYNVVYNEAGTLPDIELTWKAFAYDPLAPVFVGILVVGTNGVCTPNNMKIFKIEPLHAFTLDIANVIGGVVQDGYGDNDDNCISNIVSATINATFDAVLYDFGENTLIYAVTAANWSNSWQLSAQFQNLQAGQTVTLDWSYDITFATSFPIGVGAGPHVAADLITPQGGATSVGNEGQTIYIRAIVDHNNTWEGLDDIQYTLGVNGALADGTNPLVGNWDDIDYTTCAQVDFDDIALQTIKARPEIHDNINPPTAGDDYLPIQP